MAAQHIVREIYKREIIDDGGGGGDSSSNSSGGGSSTALVGETRQTIATKRSITLLFTLGAMVAEAGGNGGSLYEEGLNLLDTALQLLHQNSNGSSSSSDSSGSGDSVDRPAHWPRAARIARAWYNSAFCLLMMSTEQGGVDSGPWRFSPPSGGQPGTTDGPPFLDDVRRRLWESVKEGRRAGGNYDGTKASLAALRSLSLPEPPPSTNGV